MQEQTRDGRTDIDTLLGGRNIIVLDVENAHAAEDCRYCGHSESIHIGNFPAHCGHFARIGWEDKQALGLSVGCFFDYRDSRIHWFDATNLERTLRYFVTREALLVSFNGLTHDFPLMRILVRARAAALEEVAPALARLLSELCDAFKAQCAASYDILDTLWQVDPARKFERGLNSLDALAQANDLGATLSSGSEAPRLWAEGQVAAVLNSCQSDVYLTKALFERILESGEIFRGDGQLITLPQPRIA